MIHSPFFLVVHGGVQKLNASFSLSTRFPNSARISALIVPQVGSLLDYGCL
jgi:hypothetical protein